MDDSDIFFSARAIVTATIDGRTWARRTRSATEGRWSRLAVWLQRGGHLPSETWSERCSPLMMLFLGCLTSQLTRQCFISFLGIKVCLCIPSKAATYGVTDDTVLRASLSYSTHGATVAADDQIHRSSSNSSSGSSGGSSSGSRMAEPISPRGKRTPAVRCQRQRVDVLTWEGPVGQCVWYCVVLCCIVWQLWNVFTAQLTSSKQPFQ